MTRHSPISVLLVHDHPLVREGLHAVLSATDDITVAGEASDGRTAVELSAGLQPDVVIMDLQLPELHGIDATREIVAGRPGTAVLVLTMFEDDDMVFSAMSAGAAGYLLKGADGTDILTAVRAAAAGQAVFGAALAQRLSAWFAPGPQPQAAPFPQLTSTGAGDTRWRRRGTDERPDRAANVLVSKDRGQQRVQHPRQDATGRARPGHRRRPRRRTRPPGPAPGRRNSKTTMTRTRSVMPQACLGPAASRSGSRAWPAPGPSQS